MVWACFSWTGVGPIHWIKETMDQSVYVNLLTNIMVPYAEENMPLIWKFQQDNDPKHTSKGAREWFQRNNVDLLTWPSQSPDLNPIEHLWKYVKDALGNTRLKKKEDLWSDVKKYGNQYHHQFVKS